MRGSGEEDDSLDFFSRGRHDRIKDRGILLMPCGELWICIMRGSGEEDIPWIPWLDQFVMF
jgi:hypothetical protein